MNAALESITDYEQFVYSLQEQYAAIEHSTLIVVHRGPHRCQLQGELSFFRNIVLRVYERIDFISKAIAYYSYEVHKDGQLMYWYDPQPHPNDPTLAFNHPHHKHVPPDIKHHRIPAPELSFDRPNLSFLVQEIISVLLQ